MNFTKDKTATMIALFLMFAMAFSLVALPAANAHDPPWEIPTWMYCTATPSPVGVNQQILIIYWCNWIPPTANGEYGDRWTFTLDITKPNGDKQTVGPITSDPIGGGYYPYTPDQVGNYTFVAHFVESVVTNAKPNPNPVSYNNSPYINDTFKASTSNTWTEIVQEEPLTALPETPLPTNYWTRPINAYNRNWNTIAGNWLSTWYPIVNGFQPFSTGPETAHIAWTKPFTTGGIAGGSTGVAANGGPTSYYTGSSYEIEWSGYPYTELTPIIMNGYLYYNVQDPPRYGWYAVDLRTGETMWFQNSTGPLQSGYGTGNSGYYPQLSFGQILEYNSVNQEGAFAYLWSTYNDPSLPSGPFPQTRRVWDMYNAFSGNYICSITNVPTSSGSMSTTKVAASPVDGSLLIYCFDPTNGWLACWNSSQAIQYATYAGGSNVYWEWRPYLGYVYDGRNGYVWNVSISKDLRLPFVSPSATTLTAAITSFGVVFPEDSLSTAEPTMLLGYSGGGTYSTGAYSVWALSLKPESRGQLVWKKDYAMPIGDPAFENMTIFVGPNADGADGVFVVSLKETAQLVGYDLATGNKLWGPTAPEDPWQMYSVGRDYGWPVMAYGRIYVYGMAGKVYCYNVTTGELQWVASTAACGLDAPYPNYPTGSYAGAKTAVIADGKIYLTTDEHSETQPFYRGWATYCWDAYTGAPVWNITGVFGTNMQIADGYAVTLGAMDQLIYCFGKGPTDTTVNASPEVSVHGDSVLIKGMVTDISAGTKSSNIATRFPDGVPAIADESMSAWMNYLYMQMTEPKDAKGVEVKLETLDPNGNFYEIGSTTSDANGLYSYAFTPEVPGLYTIIATFEGSGSYFSSVAETAINVAEAPQASPTPTPPPTMTDTYVIGFGTVMIIMIAVIGALLLLRKR